MKKWRGNPESLGVIAFLAMAIGALDAYSYLHRGGVFASMQTGNMLLLTIRLTRGDLPGAAHYLLPILAFAAGAAVTEMLRKRKGGSLRWQQRVVLCEILALTIAAFLPTGVWDNVVNSLIAIACSMQLSTFRTVRGLAFASTMCTGNLRSAAEFIYHGAAEKQPGAFRSAGCYLAVIGCFLAGAAAGSLLLPLMGQWTVLFSVLSLLPAVILLHGGDN
ncbi:MAG: DUF1275 domain-containing protein [Ruminococcaceae bacterium]|nr:DUF1275 domain-containing protein [Oscillospiraceae bacterium]